MMRLASFMKVMVDEYKCQGHALCAVKCPEVYVLNDEGYNSMGTFEVVEGQEDKAKLGAACCPEEAISIIE